MIALGTNPGAFLFSGVEMEMLNQVQHDAVLGVTIVIPGLTRNLQTSQRIDRVVVGFVFL